MNTWASFAIVIAAGTAAACGNSPTAPSDGSTGRRVQGQTVSATDGVPAGNVAVQVGRDRVMTDAAGMFEMGVEGSGEYSALLSSGATVERRTVISAATGDRIRLPLIPSTFDLTAFDEMFRTTHARLQRWATRPRLVIVASVMDYRTSYHDYFPATSEQMTPEEVAAMTAHMTEGLALLTGGTYTSFASVDVERPAEGTRVLVNRTDSIVVARYNDIVLFALTIGYGQWAESSDGTITGGTMFLDRDFDRGDGRRRLLRIHELGHALGYRHVTARTSVMNPAIGPEPTEFDRLASIIAFQRPPGNRAPDTDPGWTATTTFTRVTAGGSTWARPVPCQPTH